MYQQIQMVTLDRSHLFMVSEIVLRPEQTMEMKIKIFQVQIMQL